MERITPDGEMWKRVAEANRVERLARQSGSVDPYIIEQRAKAESKKDREELDARLNQLTPDEQFAIRKAFGLDGGRVLSNKKIAKSLEIGVREVKALISSGLQKLRL